MAQTYFTEQCRDICSCPIQMMQHGVDFRTQVLVLALIGSMWLLLSLTIAQRVALGLSLCTSSSVRTSLLGSVMVKTCTRRKVCQIASRLAPRYLSQLEMRKTVLTSMAWKKVAPCS